MPNEPREIHPVTFFDHDETPIRGVKDWRPKIQKVEEESKAQDEDQDETPDQAGTASGAKL